MLWLKAALRALLLVALLAAAGLAVAEDASSDQHTIALVTCGQVEAGPSGDVSEAEHCWQHCQPCFLAPEALPDTAFGTEPILARLTHTRLTGRSAAPPLSPPIA